MTLYQEALQRFRELLEQAGDLGLDYPTAMTLATVDADGQPAARTVLLKGVDERGFSFYTNKQSRKGAQLAANPRASLLFYWQGLRQQVEIQGRCEDVSEAEADEYWVTRPRESRVGAWASQQSQPLVARENLEELYARYAKKFGEGDIPRPPHWSGYLLRPERIEFWREGAHRLHHRECFYLEAGEWHSTLLNP